MRGFWSTLLRRRHVPVFVCSICQKEITEDQQAAMLHGVEDWSLATVHRRCLPAYRRPAVIRLMSR